MGRVEKGITMKISELQNVVEELNESIWELTENPVHLFSFGSTGTEEFIMYGKEYMWVSEDDDRIWVTEHEKEPLISHIKRKFNEYVDELMVIYFIEPK